VIYYNRFYYQAIEMAGKEEKNMAVNDSLPVKQILNVFHEHSTDEMWIDYDSSADVLYVNFQRPVHADDSEMRDDDTIVRYQNGQVVGLTILNASTKP